MPYIADLHLHSRYSRATSREMELESLAHWARKKGISLLGTGDFTHPTYFAELQAKLTPAEPGLYRMKKGEQGIRFVLQVEVFPEEGKYHFDGHRACGVRTSPAETRASGRRCLVCRGPLTVGVLHRVENLADRPPGGIPAGAVPFKRLVPLEEIIAAAIGQGVGTVAVRQEYERLVAAAGGEFAILVELSQEDLESFVPPRVLKAILRVREELVTIAPEYDGVYGTIKIFGDEPVETKSLSLLGQMHLF
ncbi:MAG: hypothetical protein V3R69_04645 [candidate division NC10 bacterium]|nr:hypothetical protein [candidate division NC10 bacterium]